MKKILDHFNLVKFFRNFYLGVLVLHGATVTAIKEIKEEDGVNIWWAYPLIFAFSALHYIVKIY